MEQVDVSIVTTTFNRGHLLPRVWASLANQTVGFEWIVVDDASTDGTPAVMAGLTDPRIRYIRYDQNRGGPAAGRNQGARESLGRYVVFLDDDDELYPGALARMTETLDGADPSIGGVLFQSLFPDGSRWRERIEHGAVYDERDVVCRRVLGHDKIIIYRREVFDHFGLPEDLGFVEGVFVFAMTKRYKFLMIDEPGRVHHVSGVRVSNSAGVIRNSRRIALGYERILENHREVLAGCADARIVYEVKALYRYSLAGERRAAWRMFKEVARHRRPMAGLFAAGVLAIGSVGLGPTLERIRLPLGEKRSVQRSKA